MLKIRKKRLVLSALATAGLILPAGVFAVGNLAKTNNTFAYDINEATETAMTESGVYGFHDANLWGCVVKAARGNNAPQSAYEEKLTGPELAQIDELHCWGTGGVAINIAGINMLTGLTFLQIANYNFPSINLSYFNNLKTLDLSNNTTLKRIGDPDVVGTDGPDSKFNCGPNLETVSISGDTGLAGNIDLSGYSKLTSLDISGAKNITGLDVSNTKLSGILQWNSFPKLASVNVRGVSGITKLDISDTKVTELDVSTNTKLVNLNANDAQINAITLPDTDTLEIVGLANNNLPSTITLPSSCGIKYLNLRGNSRLSKINNLSGCSELISLAIQNDNFSTIDISENTKLEAFKATGNDNLATTKAKAIDITNNKSLKNIQLSGNVSVDKYVKATDVEPTPVSGGFEYDFSDYSFVGSVNAVSFFDEDSYDVSGKKITVTDYASTNGYAQVWQNPDPSGSACSGSTTDDYKCNNSENTYFKNNYRVVLDEPEEGEKFTLRFDGTGGTGAPDPIECDDANDCKVTIPEADMKKAGYNFEGWATTESGTARFHAGDVFPLNQDKTVYAKWVAASPEGEKYTITFRANGGSGGPSSLTCTDSSDCKVKIPNDNVPTRSGYDFLGWSRDENAEEPDSAYSLGRNVALEEDITLYAIWDKHDDPTPTTYKLIFDPNGGKGDAKSVPCSIIAGNCTVEIRASYAPERDDYSFLGWSDDKNATTADPQYGVGKVITLSGSDKTIYAVWTPDTPDTKKFVVSFDANEGKDAPESVSCKGEGSCDTNIPKETPTRDGYKFIGWGATKDAKEVAYKPGDKITLADDLTLFAMWEKTGSDKEAEGGIAAPNTGGNLEGGNGGLVAVLTAAPIIALGALVGIKLTKGRKSHIKFD